MKHLFDSSDNDVYTKEYINFGVGAPGPDLLERCCEIFKEATNSRMNYEKENSSYLFQYGPTAGQDDFREALAVFLSKNYKTPSRASDLILTAGASHGMHLLWTLLMHPNALVIVDEVTYMILLECLREFPGFKLESCPLESDGPDLKAMREILMRYGVNNKEVKDNRYPCMYYTIPVFHNPTGITFSEQKGKDLIKLCREFNVLVACDDVYNFLHYAEGADDQPDCNKVSRLFTLDDPKDADYKGTVISNGSFSKIFAPGVRVGWIEAPEWATEVLRESGILKSGGAVNNYVSGLLTTIMQTGRMDETLHVYRQEYEKRMRLATSILVAELNPLVKFKDPQGGYFLWLVFPEGFDVGAFNQRLRADYKVFAIPGGRFSLTGGSQNCLRVCVVFHQLDVIEQGIRRLCQASHELLLPPINN